MPSRSSTSTPASSPARSAAAGTSSRSSTAWVVRPPAAASTRSIRVSSRAVRDSTASCSEDARAANNSSTKNGLPPARACTSSTTRGGDRSALEPFDQPRRLRPVQRVELDPGHVRAARQFGDEPAQGLR